MILLKSLIKIFIERNYRGVSFKIYDDSIEDKECDNHGYYDAEKEKGNGGNNNSPYSSNNDVGDSNYTEGFGGKPLTKPLPDALADQGHTLQELANCISNRIEQAGFGTRAGVVEAGVGLIQCTYDLTGGYTYPYNHSGADPGNLGEGLLNPNWGVIGGSGCGVKPCRLGLNCATFVRTSFCSGGMDMCNKGSRAAHEMFEKTYYPEATKVLIAPVFRYVFGNIPVSSAEEAFELIKPGDMLYSEHYPRIVEENHGNHVMLVVGKTDNSITIAENGRDMRTISKKEILHPSKLQYGILLLDDYYANSNNVRTQKLA